MFPVIYFHRKDAILTSLALDKIMVSLGYLSNSQKNKDIHETMEFEGQIFVDCGIFQKGFYKHFVNERKVVEYLFKIIEWYRHLKPDIASALDIPSQKCANKKVKVSRLKWSIKNYKVMREVIDTPLYLGVSVFSLDEIKLAHKLINNIVGDTPEYIALGGLVPLMRQFEKNIKLGKIILRTIFEFHKVFPNSYLHVYGLGDHIWYPLIRLVGATSSDYASYVLISAKGKVILPGTFPKYISNITRIKKDNKLVYYRRPKDQTFSKEEIKLLNSCQCPVCKKFSVKELESNLEYRLIHNLFVILEESRIVDKFCSEDNREGLLNHMKERFKNQRKILSLIDYAQKLIKRR